VRQRLIDPAHRGFCTLTIRFPSGAACYRITGASGSGSAPFFLLTGDGVPPELIEPPCNALPCGDALSVPGDNQSTNPFRNEAGGIVPMLAFNLKRTGPKLAIIREH